MASDNLAAINVFVTACNRATMAFIGFLKRENVTDARIFLSAVQDLEHILQTAKQRAREMLPAGDSMRKDE